MMTLVRRLLARPLLLLNVSVSATTRRPRPGEVAGRDYVFLAPDQFEAVRGELLESATVHGHSYGTPAEPVRRAMAKGLCVALVIDVQGGFQVREKVPDALLVFIRGPSLDELEMAVKYDFQVVNDELDRAVEELAGILALNGCGSRRDHD
jgi:guanylate kinase